MAELVPVVLAGILRVAPAAHAGAPVGCLIAPPLGHHGEEVLYQGNGFIAGQVTIEGTPAVRRVRLFDAQFGRLIAEVWSDAAGHYRFVGLNTARDYLVLAEDHLRQFNAVVADRVSAVTTP